MRPLTHDTYEFVIQLKCHQRIRQVSQPLLENTSNNVDVVVVQIHVLHICGTTKTMQTQNTDTE